MSAENRKTSLRGLRTFCVAAKHESFREAAQALYITASAVSHQVRNLEKELGCRLFDREARSLALTATGSELYNELAPVIERLDEITARHKHTTSRHTLRISVQPFFASELFVPRLAEFRAQHPEIDIKVDTSDESMAKHPNYADASIRVFASAPRNHLSDYLFPLRLIPAASPEFRHKLKMESRKVRSDFPRIVHENRPSAWDEWQQAAGIELPKATTTLRLGSMIAVVRAAQRGLGAALVPRKLCGTMFESGSLVALFDHELETEDAFYFVCDDGERNEGVRAMRNWVVRSIAE